MFNKFICHMKYSDSDKDSFYYKRMDKEFSLLCVTLDRSHVLIFLNIVAVKITLKTVTQFPTNMRFSHENSFNTLITLEDRWKSLKL